MSDELRARVAKIFCADKNGPWPECVCSTKEALDCPECLMHADAAIALVRAETLEEAARAVEGQIDETYTVEDLAGNKYAAAAIRALVKP